MSRLENLRRLNDRLVAFVARKQSDLADTDVEEYAGLLAEAQALGLPTEGADLRETDRRRAFGSYNPRRDDRQMVHKQITVCERAPAVMGPLRRAIEEEQARVRRFATPGAVLDERAGLLGQLFDAYLADPERSEFSASLWHGDDETVLHIRHPGLPGDLLSPMRSHFEALITEGSLVVTGGPPDHRTITIPTAIVRGVLERDIGSPQNVNSSQSVMPTLSAATMIVIGRLDARTTTVINDRRSIVKIDAGDWESLVLALAPANVSRADVEELEQLHSEDQAEDTTQPIGRRVRGWMAARALAGLDGLISAGLADAAPGALEYVETVTRGFLGA